MKATTLVGVLLIILGIVGLAYPRISYTTREKVVDIGPIEATKETKKSADSTNLRRYWAP